MLQVLWCWATTHFVHGVLSDSLCSFTGEMEPHGHMVYSFTKHVDRRCHEWEEYTVDVNTNEFVSI